MLFVVADMKVILRKGSAAYSIVGPLLDSSIKKYNFSAIKSAKRLLSTNTRSSTSWIHCLPPQIRPYLLLARADKQVGSLLLFWPCCWSTGMRIAIPTENIIFSIF